MFTLWTCTPKCMVSTRVPYTQLRLTHDTCTMDPCGWVLCWTHTHRVFILFSSLLECVLNAHWHWHYSLTHCHQSQWHVTQWHRLTPGHCCCYTLGWLGWLAYDIYLAVDWSIDSLDPIVSNRIHVVHCNTNFVYIQDHLRTALSPIQVPLFWSVYAFLIVFRLVVKFFLRLAPTTVNIKPMTTNKGRMVLNVLPLATQ